MPLVAAETVIRDWLAQQFSTARVLTETPDNLADVVPVLQVTRFGGADALLNVDTANVDVETFDGPHDNLSARENARTLAEQVRSSLRLDLPGNTVAGAFVAEVATISAPTWTPYDNTNVRRFTASYRITIRSII